MLAGAGVAHASAKAQCIAAADEGQAARDAGKLMSAHAAFLRCADPACPATIRRHCSEWVDDVAERLPSITIAARDAQGHDLEGATFAIDGESLDGAAGGRPVRLDPGEHRVEARARDGRSREVRFVLLEGEKARRVFVSFPEPAARPAPRALPAPPPPVPGAEASATPRWVAPTLVVSSVVLGGTAAYLGATSLSDLDDLHEGCGVTASCTHSEVSSVRTRMLVADILGVAALVSGAAGGYLWLSR